MPVTVPCPSPNCGTKLRIPDNAVGKRVKCSKCGTTFTAQAPEEPLEVPAVEEDKVQAPAPAPAPAPASAPAPRPGPRMVEPDDEPREERLQEERLEEAPPPRRRHRDDDEDDDDRYDDEDRPRRRRPRGEEGGIISTLVPARNGRALGAYYCGIFSLIPCIGNFLGIIAIILGLLGLSFASRYPTAKGKGHAIAGIILGLVGLLWTWGFVIGMGIYMWPDIQAFMH